MEEKGAAGEQKIYLDAFKPRPYQLPLLDALENKGFKRALAVMPRRCLSGESHVLMANGSYKLLKDIKVGDVILSWNGHSFEPDKVKNAWSTGIKNTWEVRSGKYLPLISSDNHQFAHTSCLDSPVRWDELRDIGKNRSLMQYAGTDIGSVSNPLLAEFWGYMLGDGYVAGYQQPKFTSSNKEILQRVEHLALSLFDVKVIWREKGNGYDLGFSNKTFGGGKTQNDIKEFFRKEGCDVPKSQRNLPDSIWEFDKESLYAFFKGLLSADGNIYCQKEGFVAEDTGHTVTPSVELTISCGASDSYAWSIYWLLRKLGIVPQSPCKERTSNWKIKVGKSSAIRKLLSGSPIYGKREAQQKALDAIKDFTKEASVFKGCFRSRLSKVEGGDQELFDIETENNHNFIANGYIVHNSGKDITAWNFMIRAALRKVGVYFYCAPKYSQGRKIIWDSITNDGFKFIDYIPPELIERQNDQQMKIHLVNNSLIQVIGSDSYDQSLVGSNPQGIVFTEWALCDPRAYQYARPILAANDGFAVFLSTPRGKNHLWNMLQMAKDSPSWFTQHLTLDDTKHIPLEEIQKERDEEEISECFIQQEYYCSFERAAEGAYYAKYIDELWRNGQIGNVPWDSSRKVQTAWDLGVRDSNSIIFFQASGESIRIIDFYENNKEGLEHYIQLINSKPYVYGKHIAPHDIKVKEWGTGMTRIEKAKRLGIDFVVAKNMSVIDGIEAVRSSLGRVWIDERRCAKLIKSLENYRQEWDSKREVYKVKPLHDKHSHAADAMRYLCVSLSYTKDGTTPEELERRYHEAMYGNDSHDNLFGRR